MAPSRAQLVDYALSAIPGFVPLRWEQKFRLLISFHDWAETEEVVRKVEVTVGVALGKIAEAQPPLTVREACEGGGSGLWGVRGKLVFGSVWQGRKWERLGERNSFCM